MVLIMIKICHLSQNKVAIKMSQQSISLGQKHETPRQITKQVEGTLKTQQCNGRPSIE